MRALRAILGASTLLLALLLLALIAGSWWAVRHRVPDGSYAARLRTFDVGGAAVVVNDVDGALNPRPPVTLLPRTTLRITARDTAGPLFIGAAPQRDAARYLGHTGYTSVSRVSPAWDGPLPVTTLAVSGTATPLASPDDRSFWAGHADDGVLVWQPYRRDGQPTSLVILRPDGSAPDRVTLEIAVVAPWLRPMLWIANGGGAIALALASALLALLRPERRSRTVVVGGDVAAAGERWFEVNQAYVPRRGWDNEPAGYPTRPGRQAAPAQPVEPPAHLTAPGPAAGPAQPGPAAWAAQPDLAAWAAQQAAALRWSPVPGGPAGRPRRAQVAGSPTPLAAEVPAPQVAPSPAPQVALSPAPQAADVPAPQVVSVTPVPPQIITTGYPAGWPEWTGAAVVRGQRPYRGACEAEPGEQTASDGAPAPERTATDAPLPGC